MTLHPAIAKGKVAVVTGAADGIGLAAAHAFAQQGMRVFMADINADKLTQAATGIPGAQTVELDVSQYDAVRALRDNVYAQAQRVDVLMNNAGTALPSHSWQSRDHWQRMIDVNLWGVINGLQAFVEPMLAQGETGLIINTGSKQGITCPPGNPAYNASKAAVKSVTESLQHDLRNTEGCRLSAHLLVPGFTYTGLVRKFMPEMPHSAWTSEQVVEYMLEALARGDFYILCPDNDVDRETDNKRMAWAMGDLIENRPPLSRWHPDYSEGFMRFMAED